MKKEELRGRARYFIAAARSLIDEEGVGSLSARKVGARAGYSYATLYNYFADMNELIMAAMIETLEELHHLIIVRTEGIGVPQRKLLEGVEAYLDYFEEHPQRFHLTMVHPVPHMTQTPQVPGIMPSMIAFLEQCEKQGARLIGSPGETAEIIGSSLHGKLLFYFTGRGYGTYAELREAVIGEIGLLVKSGEVEA